jgi:rubrerythrin
MRAPDHSIRLALVPILLFALAGFSACQGSDADSSNLTGVSDPVEVNLESITVDDPLYEVLDTALQDEYEAQATYASAIDVYGDVRPFTRIVPAEGRHVAAVARLFEKRGLPAPDWDAAAHPVPADFSQLELAEACALGYQEEIANVAMYTELIGLDLPADVQSVFLSLQSASELNHQAAFSRCM